MSMQWDFAAPLLILFSSPLIPVNFLPSTLANLIECDNNFSLIYFLSFCKAFLLFSQKFLLDIRKRILKARPEYSTSNITLIVLTVHREIVLWHAFPSAIISWMLMRRFNVFECFWCFYGDLVRFFVQHSECYGQFYIIQCKKCLHNNSSLLLPVGLSFLSRQPRTINFIRVRN